MFVVPNGVANLRKKRKIKWNEYSKEKKIQVLKNKYKKKKYHEEVPDWYLNQLIPYDVWWYRNYMNGVDNNNRKIKHVNMYMQCFRWPTRIFQFYC